MTSRQDAVETALKQVEENVAAIDAKILQSNAQMSTLSANSKQTQNTEDGLTSDIKKLSGRIDNMLTESDEIAKRKTSVVVKGLMESEEVEDVALVTEALKAIEIQDVPIKVTLIGEKRNDGRSRSIRMAFDTEETKKKGARKSEEYVQDSIRWFEI